MTNKERYIGVTEIAEYFNISAFILNQIFKKLGWMIKDNEDYILRITPR